MRIEIVPAGRGPAVIDECVARGPGTVVIDLRRISDSDEPSVGEAIRRTVDAHAWDFLRAGTHTVVLACHVGIARSQYAAHYLMSQYWPLFDPFEADLRQVERVRGSWLGRNIHEKRATRHAAHCDATGESKLIGMGATTVAAGVEGREAGEPGGEPM